MPRTANGNSSERSAASSVQLSRYRTVVFVSTPVFRLAWWAVLLLHVTAGIFVFCEGTVHMILSFPAVHANTAALLIPLSLKRLTGSAYLLVAILHFVGMARMIRSSIRCGRLRLQFSNHTRILTTSVYQSHITTQHFLIHYGGKKASVRSVHRRFRRLSENLLGPDGYFGINGPYFTPTMLVRELAEVVMQSYQLWCLSYYVSRSWINRFAVGTVVLNCFSIPLVSCLFKKSEHIRRLMHLTVDMYLDFTCSIAIPVLVLLPYLLSFNWSTGQFPLYLTGDDVWFANAVAESRQVLVTSYIDFFSSLLPQYSIFNCVRMIKRLVHRQTRTVSFPAAAAVLQSDPQLGMHNPPGKAVPRSESRGVWVVGFCIAFWGLTALGFHIDAEWTSHLEGITGCQLYVRPWFATKVPCSVLRVNCYRRGIGGSSSEMAVALADLEEGVLTKVIFAHCPALVSRTLVEWPANAAIKQSTHPMMVNIFVSYSDLTSIPRGLLHRELPVSLLTIGFINSTISELPADLGDLWENSNLGRIGFDGTQIRSLPLSLGKMRLRKLWLSANPIEVFPEGVFNNSRFSSVRLSGMPLTLLPENMGDTTKLKELVVEHTNVTSLPAWATAWLNSHTDDSELKKKSFFGSSICDSMTSELKEEWRICEQELDLPNDLAPYSGGMDRYPL